MCVDGAGDLPIARLLHRPLPGVLVASGHRVERLAVRRGVLQPLYVAAAAHQTSVQRIAPFVRLVGQLHAALLAHVTVHVEVLVHRDHPHSFLGALHRRNTWNVSVSNRGD